MPTKVRRMSDAEKRRAKDRLLHDQSIKSVAKAFGMGDVGLERQFPADEWTEIMEARKALRTNYKDAKCAAPASYRATGGFMFGGG